jgi:hypothetical protein
MLGLTKYVLRLRAAVAALVPSVAVALGLMGVSGATADDGAARSSGSRTGTVLRYRIDVAQMRARWRQSIQTRRFLKNGNTGHDGAVLAGDRIQVEFALDTPGNTGQRSAAVLDGKVLSAPVVRSEIPGGRGRITGISSQEEAVRVAFQMGSGTLPAPLLLVEERTIELTARRRE